jgi:hypothetical protein
MMVVAQLLLHPSGPVDVTLFSLLYWALLVLGQQTNNNCTLHGPMCMPKFDLMTPSLGQVHQPVDSHEKLGGWITVLAY